MANIDYYAIESSIQSVLSAALTGVNIFIEEWPLPGPDLMPCALIYLTGRQAPVDQPIANGQYLWIDVDASIWVWAYHLENIRSAINRRDTILGSAETALMAARDLSGSVQIMLIEGGTLETARDTSGYVAGGEIKLKIRVEASF